MIVINTEQGSDEWFEYRLGIPSASKFSAVMAKGQGKTRKSYVIAKASEILTGKMPEPYTNEHMQRGIEQEPDARSLYEFQSDVEVQEVGLALLDDKSACASPDGLVSTDGGVEIKSVLPTVHIETIMSGKMPTGHNPQVQGNLWIWEREWWDFISYSPDVTDKPIFIHRVYRDEGYIKTLASEIKRFNDDVQEIVKLIRG